MLKSMRGFLKISIAYFNIRSSGQLSRRTQCFLVERSVSDFVNSVNKTFFHVSCLFSKAAYDADKVKAKTFVEKPDKKKKEKVTYITLVESNDNVTVMTLEDATKLALRRNLKLIKIKEYDTKSERPTYKLITTSQYLADEKRSKERSAKSSSIKGTKLVSISSKINEHDLNAKVNNMIKWLDKRNEVRVVVSPANGEAEDIFNKITDGVKEVGKIVQKRIKGVDLKFQVVPLKKPSKQIDKPTSSVDPCK